MNRRFSVWVVVILAGLAPSRASAQVYELIELGIQYAGGINDSGAVTGYGWYGGDVYYAHIQKDGLLINLGALQPGGSTLAYGINNSDQIVGGTYLPPNVALRRAFVWQGFAMADLGTPAGSMADATCINDSGWVAGQVTDSLGRFQGFFWKDSVLTDIGTLGGLGTGASGINNAGQVVGSSRLNDTMAHAFRWQNGSISDLGTLGGYNSQAAAINSSGEVVGWSGLNGTSGSAAFLYSGGGMSNLGFISAGNMSFQAASMATDINDSGDVVGRSTWDLDDYHAFVWEDGSMTDLNSVSDTSGGWLLTHATGINNSGNIISWAIKGGVPYSVLLRKLPIYIQEPAGGELWLATETDTIRWLAPKGGLLNIDYTEDHRAVTPTWRSIAVNVVSDSGKYGWKIPDGVNTYFGKVRIVDAADPTKWATSRSFRIRTLEMVRLNEDSTFTKFIHGVDSWKFENSGANMWPFTWYFQFLYRGGTDPFLNEPYPDESPFDSARGSEFPDWPLFVNTFGEDVCYKPVFFGLGKDYNQIATAKWKAMKGVWAGSCSGLSLGAILGFDDRQAVVQRYEDFPAGGNLYDVVLGDSLMLILNSLSLHWDGRQHLEYVGFSSRVRPRGLIEDIRTTFLAESYDHPYLYFSWIDDQGKPTAHAVVPYKLERDTARPAWYNVKVFDVSYPASNPALIQIDSTGDSAVAPLWSAKKLTLVHLMDPASSYLQSPGLGTAMSPIALPAAQSATQDIQIWPGGSSSVRIERASGGAIGFVDGALIDSIPGSLYFVPPTASPTPPVYYGVPGDDYQITLADFTEPSVLVSVFAGYGAFSYERFDADPSQTDHLGYNYGFSVWNRDSAAKNATVESIHHPSGGTMKYRLSGVALLQDDSLRIDQDETTLTIANHGSPKLSRMFAKWVSYYKSTATFAHPAFAVPANATLTVAPNDDSLGVLRVLVDEGSDGSVDDTTFVGNTLVGVSEPGSGALPTSFALHQNFPNPFNPSTVIPFDLPAATQVTIKLYDILGREVAVILDESRQAGRQSVEWIARGVPSGVYYYRIQAGGFWATKTLVLTR